MSVAYDFAPAVSVPARVRPETRSRPVGVARGAASAAMPLSAPLPAPTPAPTPVAVPERSGSVAVLHPPAPERVPLRLTQRGVIVLALAVALLAGGLVWLARLSAPQAVAPRVTAHVVVVQSGDTLWEIATRVAPGADPQAEVDRLMRRNHLTDAGQLRPGMQLQVP